MAKRIESWRGVGRVSVTRDAKGRFASGKQTRLDRALIRRPTSRLSDAERARRVSLRRAQKEAKTRKYTKKQAKKAKAQRRPPKPQTRIGPLETALSMYGTVRISGEVSTRRYDFIGGSGKERYNAIRLAKYHPPRERFTTVRTRDFLVNPSKYSSRGDWLDSEVDSK